MLAFLKNIFGSINTSTYLTYFESYDLYSIHVI